MSIAVDLADLPAEVARFGSSALLVTSSSGGPPHISSVLVTFEFDNLTMRVGRKTLANIAEQPAVTLVWPGTPDGDYCLIVDAAAREAPAATLLLRPTSAVLHRLAKE